MLYCTNRKMKASQKDIKYRRKYFVFKAKIFTTDNIIIFIYRNCIYASKIILYYTLLTIIIGY